MAARRAIPSRLTSYISMLLILSPAPPRLLTCILPPALGAAPLCGPKRLMGFAFVWCFFFARFSFEVQGESMLSVGEWKFEAEAARTARGAVAWSAGEVKEG